MLAQLAGGYDQSFIKKPQCSGLALHLVKALSLFKIEETCVKTNQPLQPQLDLSSLYH